MSSGFRVPDKDLSAIQAAIVCFDSFTDTNGTSLDAHTMDHGGLTWTEHDGTWTIESNKAEAAVSASYKHTTVDAEIADAIVDCTLVQRYTDISNYNVNGLLLRFSDTNNFWRLLPHISDNAFYLHEKNAGSWTARASVAVTINDNTAYATRGIAYGQTIDGFINGGNKISYASATFNETETRQGAISIDFGTPPGSNTFDNFTVIPRTSTTYDSVLNGV